MTFANLNMKVEKLTNLLLRTVAKQCASEPEDEVQVFPENHSGFTSTAILGLLRISPENAQ